MCQIGIKELFEAMHPSQLTGAYQVDLTNPADKIESDLEYPVFYKKEGVLVADVVTTKYTADEMYPHVLIFVFGTKQPYEKLRRFVQREYNEELEEDYDYTVYSLLDPETRPEGTPGTFERMQQAMSKAKVV